MKPSHLSTVNLVMITNDNHIKKLPVREYATLQNIGVTTVYRYIKAGKLEHEVIDGNTYVVFNDNHMETNGNHMFLDRYLGIPD